MTGIISMPYEIWELIFRFLDAASVLSLSCVSHTLHAKSKSFLSVQTCDYWREACHRDLGTNNLRLCQSGNMEENWFTVYRSSLLRNTLRYRTVTSMSIPLEKRFIRCRTGVHILGCFVIITQGPVITIRHVLTGKLLAYKNASNYNIHDSLVIRKSTGPTGSLPCDILVLLCGGSTISHIAATTAHHILEQPPAITAFPSQRHSSSKATAVAHTCSLHENSVCYDDMSTLVNINKAGNVELTVSGNICCTAHHANKSLRRNSAPLNDSVFIQFSTTNGIVISSCGKGRDTQRSDVVIPVETRFWHSYGDSARIVHVDDDLVPVIVSLQTHDTASKHLVLYTLPLL
ncbi:uncharacterized protein [Watersipora subatra]|uniref:uncharacterized protein isoform X2 n=1 Tax=Watersipora subatra TaxID=2589382 RepID=UPI00355B989D